MVTGGDWGFLDLAALQVKITRLEEKAARWNAEYERLHGIWEQKRRERRRPGGKGVSDPRIGRVFGKALRDLNQNGRVALRDQIAAMKAVLDSAVRIHEAHQQADDALDQISMDVDIPPNLPKAAPSLGTNIGIGMLRAARKNLAETLKAQQASAHAAKIEAKGLRGKDRGMAEYYVTHLNKAARLTEGALKHLDKIIETEMAVMDVETSVQAANDYLAAQRVVRRVARLRHPE